MTVTGGPSGTPRARTLGRAMRAARTRREGVSIRELAQRIGYSHVTLLNWEQGKTVPEAVQLAAYLGALGVVDDEKAHIEGLARNAADPNWLAPGVGEHLGAVLDYERTARSIFTWSPLMIPGLLQTSDYARAVLSFGRTASTEIQAAVLLRIGRAEILTRRNPTEAVFVIDVAALRKRPGGLAVMADQVDHIMRLSERDNITVRVMPDTDHWHPGQNGQFVFYRFADESPIVYLEHLRSAGFPYELGDVAAYEAAADTILALAWDASRSRRALTAAAQGEL